jgi:hypothetical protein
LPQRRRFGRLDSVIPGRASGQYGGSDLANSSRRGRELLKETGFTALFSAVSGGHIEAVHALLNAGAEIVPVKGIELRAYCIGENSKRHEAILRMLDEHDTKQKASR